MTEVMAPKAVDFSPRETEVLANFYTNGLPGIASVKESDVFSWFSLYMTDKSYQEISDITKGALPLVLYISAKLNWYEKKMQYYQDLQGRITQKIASTKTKSLDFVSTMVDCMTQIYGKKINKAIAGNDIGQLESIDIKRLSIYFKSIEMLDKLTKVEAPRNPSESSTNVHINVNGSTTIKQIDENTISVQPGSDISQVLNEMSDLEDELENS